MRDSLNRLHNNSESTGTVVPARMPVAPIARLDPRVVSCIAARRELVDLYKSARPLGDITWSSSLWNVTEAVQQTQKGYSARSNALIRFTQHGEPGERIGKPFPEDNDLADVIKAFVCRRHALNPITAQRHMVYVRGWRYLVAAMGGTDVAELAPATFNAAALAATKREAKSSAYTIHSVLEQIADSLDELHLVKLRLRWAWAKKKRPPSYAGPRERKLNEPTKEDRRASDDVVYAIAQLYHTVPQSDWADRMCVLVAIILVCTGLRLGQALCLRAEMPQLDKETGEYFIRLVPFKRAVAMQKTLLTSTVELLNDVFRELLQMTAPCRDVARWLAENPGKVHLPESDRQDGTVTAAAVQDWFGLSNAQFKYRRKKWGISETVCLDELNKRLRAHRFDAPVVPGTQANQLMLADCLSISFFDGMKRSSTPLRHAVHPVTEQNISDCLRGRRLGSGRTGKNIFERYSMTDKAGNPLSSRSHSFRHKLNDALDRGGAPDLIQAQWFGRVNVGDNKPYQNRTPSEERENARNLLLSGQLEGHYANLLRQISPDRREDVASLMVQVVHPATGGYCLQNFAQVDCEHYGQCLDDCRSFHWTATEPERMHELVAIHDAVSRRLKATLDCMSADEAEKDESFVSQLKQLKAVTKILQAIQESTVGKKAK